MSLEVERLSFAYGKREVLKAVTFAAGNGEILSVLGPNGAGKSTLFRCMLGLLEPCGGTVRLEGREVAGMGARELARTAAYIPQNHAPVFPFTVFDMVLMGTAPRLGSFSVPGTLQKKQALEALEHLGVGHLKDREYQKISGGERQLVLIARALAQQARTLIMDEPCASLDLGNKIRVMRSVRELADEGYTVILSTHEPEQAYQNSDKVLALYDGEVLAWGSPGEVISAALMTRLYGADVEVCSLRNDRVRVCVPADK